MSCGKNQLTTQRVCILHPWINMVIVYKLYAL